MGFLFDTFMEERRKRADEYVQARCGNDPGNRDLLHAELIQRELHDDVMKLRLAGEKKGLKDASRLLYRATKICLTLLRERLPIETQGRLQ